MARYASEAICDLLALEAEKRKEIPSYLRSLDRREIVPKLQKSIEKLRSQVSGDLARMFLSGITVRSNSRTKRESERKGWGSQAIMRNKN